MSRARWLCSSFLCPIGLGVVESKVDNFVANSLPQKSIVLFVLKKRFLAKIIVGVWGGSWLVFEYIYFLLRAL